MTVRVAPSIFAADFFDMRSAVDRMKTAQADLIHFDVMDNHFVPNISFGPKFIADIMNSSGISGEAHLMIDLEWLFAGKPPIDSYLRLPLESLTLHLEATQNYIRPYLKAIQSAGMKAGLSIKPETPVSALRPYLDELGLILIMSVEPGFSGQSFMQDSIDRIRELHKLIGDRPIEIQVDGGVGRSNYQALVEAGARNLVMGSAFFKDKDAPGLVSAIHNLEIE